MWGRGFPEGLLWTWKSPVALKMVVVERKKYISGRAKQRKLLLLLAAAVAVVE